MNILIIPFTLIDLGLVMKNIVDTSFNFEEQFRKITLQ
jgi:hypothetical protein